MELLLKALTARGHAATLKDRKIKVKPAGLSNNIFISYDISLNRYVVKSHDLINGSMGALILLNGLWTYKTSDVFVGSMFIAMAMFGFLLIIMTELKIKSLREYMDGFNLEHQVKQCG
ncbi:hypothetical protein L2755_14690 [Shewanella abyssi]|uniref:hypothetical protein n=1 Tax=Shewanella abyssi TaxID=311789 RepID=UPI00200FC311|nr:hypothetical protein [Shewanella abyssi]MCL1050863.1 hypothetical protein [Shewanella abyssi]